MIREVTMYTVGCDEPDCEATTDDGGDYSCWESEDSAWQVAEESAGVYGGDDWLLNKPSAWCPNHRPRCTVCGIQWLSLDELDGRLCEDCTDNTTASPPVVADLGGT